MHAFPSPAAKFRFSVSELLGATAILAVGLTWPILLVFALPFLVVAVLARLGFGSLRALAGAAALAVGFGILLSQYYWRYPFVQPRMLAELRDIRVIEQLSRVRGLNSSIGAPVILSVNPIPPLSSLSWNTKTELTATDRIFRELGERKVLVRSSQPLSADFVKSVWHAADQVGLLVDGEPGYANTRTLYGQVGIAELGDGSRIAFATLMGDQHSDDHYPYYEFVIPMDQSEFAISNSQWFFADLAGLEGFNWWSFTVLSFYLLCPVAVIFGILRGCWRMYVRRRAANGAKSPHV